MTSYIAVSVVVAVAAVVLAGLPGAHSTATEQVPITKSSPSPTVTCVDATYLTAAVDHVMTAAATTEPVQVYGPPGGRHSRMLADARRENLAAERNPRGEGVLVTLVYGGDGVFAASSAHRAGWLVVHGSIYPADVDAAQAFGRLYDGYPADVQAAAGLSSSAFGLDAFGVEDFITYNADTVEQFRAFVDAGNDLCGPRAVWGS
ncbi:hypothetical protein [Curtobacterium sp. TXMA1]|uniref:hypothetical protein n=1 Tax=Curtobacterium sp. TXMA1 TaxID=2876939 RepID=UPI001CCFB0FE|nr:hypothetical protein [Curtobacterium sp. TXMA1]UBQ02765.1 hypothetical protein LCG91_00920 [Curtobacterium sp. TXMA1]